MSTLNLSPYIGEATSPPSPVETDVIAPVSHQVQMAARFHASLGLRTRPVRAIRR
jgi:hypothetical protein